MYTRRYLQLGLSKQWCRLPHSPFYQGLLREELTYRLMCIHTQMFYKLVNVPGERATFACVQTSICSMQTVYLSMGKCKSEKSNRTTFRYIVIFKIKNFKICVQCSIREFIDGLEMVLGTH